MSEFAETQRFRRQASARAAARARLARRHISAAAASLAIAWGYDTTLMEDWELEELEQCVGAYTPGGQLLDDADQAASAPVPTPPFDPECIPF